MVLVPKPDGSIWFCVDYRGVNALAKFDEYPMPKVNILIDQLGMARYYSALDLTKGYWQVPMHPPDQEKTAFATPQRLYQFTRMPFGLHGVAATFQCLVNRALNGCETFTCAYIESSYASSYAVLPGRSIWITCNKFSRHSWRWNSR